MAEKNQSPSVRARGLVRASAFAHLSTLDAKDGWPFGSLVMSACDHDGSPLILISQLAVHTKNILADTKVALLFDHTSGLENRMMQPRATVVGQAEKSNNTQHRKRFCARHANASDLLELDFSIYKVHIERGHLVGGFGDIHDISGNDLIFDTEGCGELIAHEFDIVEHMNIDHAETIGLYANRLLDLPGTDWQMTGCDPEGCDLIQGEVIARIPFPETAHNSDEARQALVALADKARKKQTP
jgi:putative heme iron utilization protein